MTTETNEPAEPRGTDNLEMPAPTMWPAIVATAVTLMGAGVVTNWLFTIVGAVILILALTNWIRLLIPGRGTHFEELAPEPERPQPVHEIPGEVEHLRPGMAGHRMRVPEKVHPYSAGAVGGLIGGAAMTIPALIYGVWSGHGIWYPANLLVGMVMSVPHLPDDTIDVSYLEQFHFGWLVLALLIHLMVSVSLGLMNGVLLPMLGNRPLLFGAVLAPLLWSGAAYGFMGVVNPAMEKLLDWPSFVAAQFVFGVVTGVYVLRTEKIYAEEAGTIGVRRARPTMSAPPPSEGNP
jgi:hypothetical protein